MISLQQVIKLVVDERIGALEDPSPYEMAAILVNTTQELGGELQEGEDYETVTMQIVRNRQRKEEVDE